MEMHPNGIKEDSEVNRKYKKELIRKIKKEKTRNNDFHFITKHVGRGVNVSLKILHEKNKKWKIIKTHATRKAIKDEIINHNQKHFAMAVRRKVHQDKMHVKLDDRVIKKKTLEGRMERRDCDNEEVFEFLQLLKKPKNAHINDFNPM